jgi:hypothetical protein
MWLKSRRPDASVHLVEPEPAALEAGRANFERNGITGEFLQAFIGNDRMSVPAYLRERGLERLDVLHADIQGFEIEMLNDSVELVARHAFDYLVISTHLDVLHGEVQRVLRHFGYRIEVACDVDSQTTSFDGLVLASSPRVQPVFDRELRPLGRLEIMRAGPLELVQSVAGALGMELRPRQEPPQGTSANVLIP